MAQKQLNMTTALKDGQIVNIDDVETGLKCGCICPACGEALVAKKGAKMKHHFAHHSGSSCEYGYESSLHLAAKDILSKAKKILLPAVFVSFTDSYKTDELAYDAVEIEIEKVVLEKRFGDVIPDVVVYAGGKQLFIEIYVTHPIDDQKLKKLCQADISTIEIDLSKKKSITSTEELQTILLSNSAEKKWKYNSLANKLLQRFYQVADTMKCVEHGLAMHIMDCPIQSRIWKGRPYANFIDDCLYCKYCISHSSGDGILCSGRLRISTVKDFKIPTEQRIKNSNNELDDMRETAFAGRTCPYCGGGLVERNGVHGMFWGCKNYPSCRFTANVDSETGRIKMRG